MVIGRTLWLLGELCGYWVNFVVIGRTLWLLGELCGYWSGDSYSEKVF